MYPQKITNKCMSGVRNVFTLLIGCAMVMGSTGQAYAQAVPSDGLFPLTSRFDLLAGDGSLSDDCDTDWLGSAGAGKDDVIMLAKLDTQKTRAAAGAPAASPKAKSAAASAGSSQDVEVLPVATPQNPTAPGAQQTWEIIVSDKTLNAALARWASKAGWQLVWELPVDYSVETKTTVYGSFEEAVGTVAKSMEGAEIPMKAMFYQGNKVLRIMAKGAE